MTFAAVGSSFTWDDTPISFTPHAVGNLVIVGALTKLATTPTVIGLSSSNVTWTQLTTTLDGTVSNTGGNIWIGLVTSTSTATVTVTWSTGSAPDHWQFDGQEFSSTVGSWALDQQGTIDTTTSNAAYASLTPAAAGELYFGTHYDDNGSSAGSTPGYVYELDSHGNGMAYNVACTAAAQAPTWGDSTVFGGVMALVKETGGTDNTATASLTVTPSLSAAGTSAGTATYSLFGQETPPSVSYGTPGATTYGTIFTLSSDAALTGIWYYSAPDDVALPVSCAVFDVATQAVVAEDDSPDWSGALGSGWVKCSFDGSVVLDTRSRGYITAIEIGAGSKGFNTDVSYPVTSGILTAPESDATSGLANAPFVPDGELTYPTADGGGGFNWFVDVEVSQAGATVHTATASLTVTSSLSATGARTGAAHTATASLTVEPSLSAAGTRAGAARTASASLTVEPSTSAGRTRAAFRSATLMVTPDLGAARTVAHHRTASLDVTPTLGAASTQAHVRTASLAVTPSYTAVPSTTGAQAHTATAALTVAPQLGAVASRTAAVAHTATAGLLVVPSFTAARTLAHSRSAALAVAPSFTVARTAAFVRSAALVVTPHLAGQARRTGQAPAVALIITAGPPHGRWSALPPHGRYSAGEPHG